MSDKKQRLSAKDWEALLKIMRHWPQTYRDGIAPLVWHCSFINEKLLKVEAQNHDLRQQGMFKSIKENETRVNSGPVEKPRKEYYPLSKRLADMIEAGLQASPQWVLTLKWNKLTEQEALALAFQCEQDLVDK